LSLPGWSPEVWALLPLATAAGLDLYLTILLLGVAPHLGWDLQVPGELTGLQLPPVLGLAGVFYGLEILAERWAPAALFWNAVHVVVRPLAAALLGLLLLHAHPARVQATGAVLAAAVASGVHAVRVGGGLVLWLARARPRTRWLAAAAEDAMVVALCALALDLPTAGTALALVLLVGAVPQARPYLDGFRFSLRASWGHTFGALDSGQWFGPGSFPGWLGEALREDPRVPGGPLRGSPAGAFRVADRKLFVHGWFVVTGGAPLFVHRSWARKRVVELGRVRATGVDEGFLDRRVELVRSDGAPGRLHFPPDGPSSDRLRAEFGVGA
jgi:hypothetical protein